MLSIIINVYVWNGSFNQIEMDMVPTAYLLVNYNRPGSTEHIFYNIYPIGLFSKPVLCLSPGIPIWTLNCLVLYLRSIRWPLDSIYVNNALVKCIYVLSNDQMRRKNEFTAVEISSGEHFKRNKRPRCC